MNLLIGTLLKLNGMFAPPDCDCKELKDCRENYLFKICTYIREKKMDISPANVCSYKIELVKEKQVDNQEVIAVYLNCCHTGDVAYFNKETLEIVGFRPGHQ